MLVNLYKLTNIKGGFIMTNKTKKQVTNDVAIEKKALKALEVYQNLSLKGRQSTQEALKAIAFRADETSISNSLLFDRVSNAVKRSVLISRVINVESLSRFTDKDILIAKYLLSMSDTQTLAMSQIAKKIKPRVSYVKDSDTEKQVQFFRLADIVKEQDVLKVAMILAAFDSNINIIANKNNQLAIQFLKDRETSLIKASFFRSIKKETEKGEIKTSRQTVDLPLIFKKLYIHALKLAKSKDNFLALLGASIKQVQIEQV